MRLLKWALVFSCGEQKIITLNHAKKKKLSIHGIFDTKKEAVECLSIIKKESK